MTVRRRSTALLALFALLPLAACAAEQGGEMEEAEGEAMEEEAPAPAAEEAPPMGPMAVALESKNESGVTGEATASHDADSVTVEVTISGASGDGTYPAHVHSGECASPGGVLAPLTPLEVMGGGGSSTTTLAAAQVPQDQGAVIQVHDWNGNPVACGSLMGHGEEGGMEGSGDEENPTGM